MQDTIGRRIAAGRKKLGLSQEALGAQLGVSRQAIYKWEQDAALPEIDKLVALSRLFGVSIGALLGVEEPAPEPQEESSELSEQQLEMVRQIVDGYLARQPKRRRWPAVLAACIAIVLAIVLVRVVDELNTVRVEYQNLQHTVSGLSSSVSQQIGGISDRVESILKEQNSLLSDYGVTQESVDLASNTVTFHLRAVPRTVSPGLTVTFTAESGAERIEQAADENFEAALTCPLTDCIELGVVLEQDGVQQNQKLETYYNRYSDSLPYFQLHTMIDGLEISSRDRLDFSQRHYVGVRTTSETEAAQPAGSDEAVLAELRIGLFRNHRLLCWAQPCAIPENYIGFDDYDFYSFPPETVDLTQLQVGDALNVAAVAVDSYGRTWVRGELSYTVQRIDEAGDCYVTYGDWEQPAPNGEGWEY